MMMSSYVEMGCGARRQVQVFFWRQESEILGLGGSVSQKLEIQIQTTSER